MIDLEKEYYYGVGRRKTATAQVRLYPGQDGGEFIVNDKSVDEYFTRLRDLRQVYEPLEVTETKGDFAVSVLVRGGGVTGQSGAIQHGMARALLEADPDLRPVLRARGLLTRDPRMKERKKAGLRKARKAPQYTKR